MLSWFNSLAQASGTPLRQDAYRGPRVSFGFEPTAPKVPVSQPELPEPEATLAKLGRVEAAKNVAGFAARSLSPDVEYQVGFDIGWGCMYFATLTGELILRRANLTMRSALPGEVHSLVGWDTAVALYRGQTMVSGAGLSNGPALAGFYIVHGLQGAKPVTVRAVMLLVTRHPQAKAGAAKALKQVRHGNG